MSGGIEATPWGQLTIKPICPEMEALLVSLYQHGKDCVVCWPLAIAAGEQLERMIAVSGEVRDALMRAALMPDPDDPEKASG